MLKRVTIYILISAALCVFNYFSNLYAQEKSNLEFLFGLNFSKINGGYIWEKPTKTPSNFNVGYNLGIGLSYKYASFMDISPQLEFIKKGSKWGIPAIPLMYEGDYIIYEISYLQLSFNHLFHLCTSERRRIDLLLGIYGAYKLTVDEEWIFENIPEGGLPVGRLDDYINDFDFGITLGVKIISLNKRISFLFRYDHGLKSINNTDEKRATTDFENKLNQNMRSILFTIGIKLKTFN